MVPKISKRKESFVKPLRTVSKSNITKKGEKQYINIMNNIEWLTEFNYIELSSNSFKKPSILYKI